MVPASPSPAAPPSPRLSSRLRRPVPWGWRMGLFVGACFGLGYGVTQRLMRAEVGLSWQGSQSFGVKPFPGTPLKTLRERYGGDPMAIRGDLDLLELERRKLMEEKEVAAREAELKRREAEEQERRMQEADRVRLEGLQRESAPPIPEPSAVGPIESPLLTPPEPQPEPPAPLPPPDAPQP